MAFKGVLSARGERVDFNLLLLKQTMVNTPKPTTVQAREDFIDVRAKRRLNRQQQKVKASVAIDLTVENKDEPKEEDKKKTK